MTSSPELLAVKPRVARGLAAVATLAGALFLTGAGIASSQAIPLVRTITAIRQDHSPTLALTGEVVARHSFNLSFRINGRISEILVETGDHVQEGAVLARLDPQLQQSDLTAALAAVAAARTQLNLARTEHDRTRELFDKGFATRAALDRAKAALAEATAALEAQEAQLDLARSALEFTRLTAPVSGTVTAVPSEEGQIAQVGQTIVNFAANGARDAVFGVPEAVLFRYSADLPIRLSLVENPQVTADCTLREVAPVITPFTGTVRVTCGIVGPPPEMVLAAAVRGSVMLPAKALFILPWRAMTSHNGTPAVWVLDRETSSVAIRPIEVESYETGRILVRGGIEEGELIVTEGARFLHDEMRVAVQEGDGK